MHKDLALHHGSITAQFKQAVHGVADPLLNPVLWNSQDLVVYVVNSNLSAGRDRLRSARPG